MRTSSGTRFAPPSVGGLSERLAAGRIRGFQSADRRNSVEQGGDTASIVVGCDFTNKEQTESDCWAALTGVDGPPKGKTGTMSWHAKSSADLKSGSSAGTGQWND